MLVKRKRKRKTRSHVTGARGVSFSSSFSTSSCRPIVPRRNHRVSPRNSCVGPQRCETRSFSQRRPLVRAALLYLRSFARHRTPEKIEHRETVTHFTSLPLSLPTIHRPDNRFALPVNSIRNTAAAALLIATAVRRNHSGERSEERDAGCGCTRVWTDRRWSTEHAERTFCGDGSAQVRRCLCQYPAEAGFCASLSLNVLCSRDNFLFFCSFLVLHCHVVDRV